MVCWQLQALRCAWVPGLQPALSSPRTSGAGLEVFAPGLGLSYGAPALPAAAGFVALFAF